MFCKDLLLVFSILFIRLVAGFQITDTFSVLDLSWTYNNNSPPWPGVQPFHFVKETFAKLDEDWYAAKEFCTGEHVGTHLDAPYHFSINGLKTDEIDPQKLIAPGVLVDVSKLVGDNRSFVLDQSHLETWEAEHGPFPNNCIVLVRFGWSRFWPNAETYYGLHSDNKSLSFPGLSANAATWIVEKGTILGVGVDVPSLDPGHSRNYSVHKILAAQNIFTMENVALTTDVPARNFTLIVAPMKIASGTGGPCRIFALV